MGWEERKGRRYYYHTYRFQGRRRRTYLGPLGDPVAELAAAYAALDLVNREMEDRKYQQEVAAPRDAPIVAGINAAWDGLVRAMGGPGAGPKDPETPAGGPETG